MVPLLFAWWLMSVLLSHANIKGVTVLIYHCRRVPPARSMTVMAIIRAGSDEHAELVFAHL